MHQNRQRQGQSPTAYSPEYSSPFSSGGDILQARFAHFSPENLKRQGGQKGGAAKENFYERQHLPIFKEDLQDGCSSDHQEQMIAQLTVADSQTTENGFVNAILSDISDENLIRQLQLEVNNVTKNNASSGAFTSSDRLADNDNSASQPFRDQTNGYMMTEQKQRLQNVDQVHANVKIEKRASRPVTQTSPQKQHNFNGSSKIPKLSWRNSTKVSVGATKAQQKTTSSVPSQRTFQQTQPSQEAISHIKHPSDRVPQQECLQRAPEPHPCPSTQQQSITSSGMPDSSRTYTVTTMCGGVNASPAIVACDEEEDNFNAYIRTNSDEKIDRQIQSCSPVVKQQVDKERFHNNVNQFSEPSTIEEQFTQEQLQASASGIGPSIRQYNIIAHNQKTFDGDKSSSCANYAPRKYVPIQEPQILSPPQQDPLIQIENQCDSESLEQIKLISQAIQKGHQSHNNLGNYSVPGGEQQKDLDTSSSLKDFSQVENEAHLTFNDYQNCHLQENNPTMLDFDRQAAKQANVTTHQVPSQLSMAVLQDALSATNMSSSSRQQAITHFIQMALQQQMDVSNSNHSQQRQGGGCCGESTLLCQSSGSVNQCKSATARQQSCDNASSTKQALQQNQLAKPSPSLAPQAGGPSPVRQRLYVQGQVPSSQLYKPVLRQSVKSSIQKNSSQKLDKNGSVSHFAGSVVTGGKADSLTPSKKTSRVMSPAPVQSAPQPTHPFLVKQSDRNSVRRNLNQQFARTQVSTSPTVASAPTALEPTRLQQVKNQRISTNVMVARDSNQRGQQLKGTRQTPSPVPTKTTTPVGGQRTRNDVFQVTRASVQAEVTAAPRQAPQRSSIKPRTTSAQTLEVPSNTAAQPSLRPSTVRPNKQMTMSQLATSAINNNNTRKSAVPTRSPTPTRRQTLGSTTSRQLYDHPQQTLTRPSLPVQPQLKASTYQVRRTAEAMKGLDIQMFLELERIKKPQAAVLAIARMSCIFFEALRNRDAVIMDQVETMQSWSQIQEYMRSQLTCCVPELRTLLKQKLISLGRINATEETPREVEIETVLLKIFENFFSETKIRVIRRFVATSKTLKGLLHLIYAFMCLALDLEREFSFDNLLGLTEQPQTRIEDLKFLFHPASSTVQSSMSSAHNTVTDIRISQNNTASHLNSFDNKREAMMRASMKGDRSIEGQSFAVDQNQSCCSKCSCHVKQQSSAARRSLNNSRSINNQKQSASRQVQTRQSQERSPAQHLYDFQTNVFQTLDTVYVEQNSYRSRQSNRSVKKVIRPEDEQYRMSLENYTTQQVAPKLQHQRTATGRSSLNADDLVTVMEPKPRQAATTKMTTARRSVSPATIAQGAAQASQCSSNRNFQSYLKPTKQMKVRSSKVNKIVQKSKRANVNLSSSRSDFSSVVRAATPTPPFKSQRLTPKASKTLKKATDLTPSRSPVRSAVACAPRKTDMKANAINGANTYRYVTNTQPQQHARMRSSVSPVNMTSRRQLQKSASNLSSLPQKKLAMAPQAPQKHQRTSTLYKNTASRTAKLRESKPVSSKSPLQRDASSKAFTKQQPIQQSQAPPSKLQSRKTKSQTNLRAVKKTTISKKNEEMLRTFESLRQDHIESIGASYLPPHNAGIDNFQASVAIAQQAVGVKDTGIPSSRLYQQTFDERKQSAAFSEEFDQQQDGCTKRTTMAPPQESFTPEKEIFMDMPDSSVQRNGYCNNIQLSPYDQVQQLTGKLGGKQSSLDQSTVSANEGTFSYIAEPHKVAPTIDPLRTDFFMEKAQAITENINSCYKERSMPHHIDMETINKLKMRRLNFMQQVYDGESQKGTRQQTTQQSCNVVTTMTVEHTISDEDEQPEGQARAEHDTSFTEALNKLKAEVACLVEQRLAKRDH